MNAPDIAFYIGWLRTRGTDPWRAVIIDECVTALSRHLDAWSAELCRRAGHDSYARRSDVREAVVGGVTDFLIAASGGHEYPRHSWYRALYDAAADAVTKRFGLRVTA